MLEEEKKPKVELKKKNKHNNFIDPHKTITSCYRYAQLKLAAKAGNDLGKPFALYLPSGKIPGNINAFAIYSFKNTGRKNSLVSKYVCIYTQALNLLAPEQLSAEKHYSCVFASFKILTSSFCYNVSWFI